MQTPAQSQNFCSTDMDKGGLDACLKVLARTMHSNTSNSDFMEKCDQLNADTD